MMRFLRTCQVRKRPIEHMCKVPVMGHLYSVQACMMPSEYDVVDANIFVRFALFTVAI